MIRKSILVLSILFVPFLRSQEVDFKTIQLSYISNDRAAGILKSLGYAVIDFEVSNGPNPNEFIYKPSGNIEDAMFNGNVKNAEDVEKQWEEIKKTDETKSIFDDIDQKLPSITKAFKTQRKAKKINLTYANYEEALQDLLSEVDELQNAKDNEDRKSEIGDILFSIVNVCRHLDADPEIQLNQSTSRFIQRAKYVENNFDEDADIEQLWKDAKKSQFK